MGVLERSREWLSKVGTFVHYLGWVVAFAGVVYSRGQGDRLYVAGSGLVMVGVGYLLNHDLRITAGHHGPSYPTDSSPRERRRAVITAGLGWMAFGAVMIWYF